MYMAIAVQVPKHPRHRDNYKIWYLKFDKRGKIISIGAKSKEELISSLFINYKKHGCSNWRSFNKGNERSTSIEPYDFIDQNIYENTHFGELPTLCEFQDTLNYLQDGVNLEQLAC